MDMHGIEAYQQTQNHVEPPRAVEYRRLGELTAQLIEANNNRSDVTLSAHAIWQNQQFWSHIRVNLLVAQLSLPQELRQQFLGLAEWVEKESILVAGDGARSLEDLIAVNQQIMEGLKPYTGALADDSLKASEG